MEGSQALTNMDTKSPEVLSTSHAQDHLLFIAPMKIEPLYPFIGHCLGGPDAPIRLTERTWSSVWST